MPLLPDRTEYTPIPNAFFSLYLEGMEDLAEVTCALRALFLLSRKRGPWRFVTLAELQGDPVLTRAVAKGKGGTGSERVKGALERCVERGLFLRLVVEQEGRREEVFFLGTPANERTVERLRRGEIALPGLPRAEPVPEAGPVPNIFRLYEENIGVITPLISEELKDAERLYPASWIAEAFREAVRRNKRSWRYIDAILRRWSEEGKGYGAPERGFEKVPVARLLRRKAPPPS